MRRGVAVVGFREYGVVLVAQVFHGCPAPRDQHLRLSQVLGAALSRGRDTVRGRGRRGGDGDVSLGVSRANARSDGAQLWRHTPRYSGAKLSGGGCVSQACVSHRNSVSTLGTRRRVWHSQVAIGRRIVHDHDHPVGPSHHHAHRLHAARAVAEAEVRHRLLLAQVPAAAVDDLQLGSAATVVQADGGAARRGACDGEGTHSKELVALTCTNE